MACYQPAIDRLFLEPHVITLTLFYLSTEEMDTVRVRDMVWKDWKNFRNIVPASNS